MAVDERCRRRGFQPTQLQHSQPSRLEAAELTLAGGEEHDDALGFDPPGDEDERVEGRVVEPVRIVDETQHRLTFGCFREETENCERDEKPVLAAPGRQAECSAEGGGLRLGQALEVPEGRAEDLLQGSEGELRLRLDPGAAEHAHVAGSTASVFQERRLADTRLAGDDQRGAAGRPGTVEKLADAGALRISPTQHQVIVRRSNPAKSPARRRAFRARVRP